MTYTERLVLVALCSAAGHLLFVERLRSLPPPPPPLPPMTVDVTVIAKAPPPPPPLPEPPHPPPPPPPPPKPLESPRRVERSPRTPRPAAEPPAQPPPKPPPEAPPPGVPTVSDAPPAKVYGVPMAGTSTRGGMSVPIGAPRGPAGAAPIERAVAAAGNGTDPVPAYEVTRLPVPQARCAGRYTPEARAAGLEGTVVLDLVVDADGRAGDIAVVHGLGDGLTEAAVAALKSCRFSPGERNGVPVPVRVRGFKITFFLQGD